MGAYFCVIPARGLQNRDSRAILEELIRVALRSGADAADAILASNVSASVSFRLGRLEDLERAESRDLGLRVFAGAKVAFVSSTDLSPETLRELPERALAMARLAPEVPVPASLILEEQVVPGAAAIVAAARKLMDKEV